jgi:hypothetical protein
MSMQRVDRSPETAILADAGSRELGLPKIDISEKWPEELRDGGRKANSPSRLEGDIYRSNRPGRERWTIRGCYQCPKRS